MDKQDLKLLREIENSDEYWAESIIADFTKEICRIMAEEEISRSELAEKLGSSPAYITKVLRGNVNFTLTTMTKLARALNSIVRVHLAHKDAVVRWEDSAVTTDSIVEVVPRNDYAYVSVEIPPDYPFASPFFVPDANNDLQRVA
jgi:transcriptional regulator with XRE-family HTH domain